MVNLFYSPMSYIDTIIKSKQILLILLINTLFSHFNKNSYWILSNLYHFIKSYLTWKIIILLTFFKKFTIKPNTEIKVIYIFVLSLELSLLFLKS